MESHGIERHKAIWKGNYFYSGMLAKTRRAYSDFLLQTQRGVMPSKFAFFFYCSSNLVLLIKSIEQHITKKMLGLVMFALISIAADVVIRIIFHLLC